MFNDNDMIFSKENNKITSGGFEVDSFFLNNEIPVSYNLNKNDMFGGLAVPSGLLYLTNRTRMDKVGGKPTENSEAEFIGGKLYNKLFNLASKDVENKIEITKEIKELPPDPEPNLEDNSIDPDASTETSIEDSKDLNTDVPIPENVTLVNRAKTQKLNKQSRRKRIKHRRTMVRQTRNVTGKNKPIF